MDMDMDMDMDTAADMDMEDTAMGAMMTMTMTMTMAITCMARLQRCLQPRPRNPGLPPSPSLQPPLLLHTCTAPAADTATD